MEQSSPSVPSILSAVLRADPTILFDLFQLGRKLWERWQGNIGIYEVQRLEIQLEICDSQGKKAVYTKRQKVRFLQNNVIAYQDIAWGEGDIFAEYHCTPGVAVDRYQEGHRYRILISLREVKQRGDEAELNIERVIRNGFRREVEYFQAEIDHWTHFVQLSVIFPHDRLPRQVTITEQNTRHTCPLLPNQFHTLPDGRVRITWEKRRPSLYEAYILQWHW